jgi:flagellin-like protein
MGMVYSRKRQGAVGVIGVILLVAITVALAGTIYLMLQSFTPSDSAPLAVVISGQLDDDVVSLAPQAGALLAFDSTKVSIVVNGLSYPVDFQTFLSSSSYENGKWESGESLTVDLSVLAYNYSSSHSVHASVVNLNGNTLLYDTTLRKGSSGSEEPEVIVQVVTLTPSNVTFGSAAFQMTFTIEQYPSVDVRFQYKTSSGSWTDTSWVSRSEAGVFVQSVTTLSSNTAYVVKAQLRVGSMILSGEEKGFSTSDGPIALWHFNDGTGVVAVDSAHGHTGLITSATWTTGVNAGALGFDGVDDYVAVNDDSYLNPTSALTLAAWVKWTIDPATGTNWASIVTKHGDNQYRLHHNKANTKFEFAIRTTSGNKWVESLTTPVIHTWYFVVGTYDGGTLRIYVNGVFERSDSYTGNLLTSNSPVNIGRRSPSNDRYFNGVIDEVSIWDRALSASEIKDYYDQSKP